MTGAYKLPDWLGGHDCILAKDEPTDTPFVTFDVKAPDGSHWPLNVQREMLTKVEPPLPLIPDAPAVMIGDEVYIADGPLGARSWRWPGPPDDSVTDEQLVRSAQATGHGIIPLVPDLAYGAPDLPWQLKEGDAPHVYASVGKVDDEGGAFVEARSRMNPREMRTMAAALWQAAAEGEVAGQ